MKKFLLFSSFLMLLAAMPLRGWASDPEAVTDAQKTAATESITSGAQYLIKTTYNTTTYYLTTSGTLTTNADEAGEFTITRSTSRDGFEITCSTGWFTNPGGSKDRPEEGNVLRTSSPNKSNRDTETQILYLKDGKYAVRAGVGKADYGQNSFWQVKEKEVESVSTVCACYDTENRATSTPAHFDWELEKIVLDFGAYTYYIKVHNPDHNNGYVRTTPGGNNDLARTGSTDGAAKIMFVPVEGVEGYFYLYDVVGGRFINPNNTNAQNWSISDAATRVYVIDVTRSSGLTLAGEYDKVLRFKATSNATYTMGAYGNTSSTGIRSNNGTGTNETWYVKSTGETASLPTSFALNNQSSAEDVMYLANQGKNFTYPVTNFGTLVVPFDATISGGITAYDLTSATSDKVFGIEVAELTANKPVLLKGTGTLTLAKKAEGTAEVGVDLTNGLLTGVYSSTEAPVCSYVLQKLAGDSEVCFHQVAVGSQPTVKPFRAYLTNGGAGVKLSLDLDGLTDAIEQVNDEGVVTISEVYGLSGVRQSGLQRGINLVRTADGRVQKVMIK